MANLCTTPMDLVNKITGRVERVPCGYCTSCRLQKAADWATRCVHEAQLYKQNCFVTLTYAPEHLPDDHSVHKKTFKNFIKRIRRHFVDRRVRFYGCG